MPLLTLRNASLAFGHLPLLDQVDLSLDSGERLGLIGRNGTGKSSLLGVIAGRIGLDGGEIVRQSGLSIREVAQEPAFGDAGSVFEAVAQGLPGAGDLAEYQRLSHAGADQPQALQRLAQLQDRLDAQGGWAMRHRIDEIIDRLRLDPEASIDTLSGGTRKRVALARALVARPDLLLLDEPTNHLDIESIAWLESALAQWQGSLIVITHDRRFLDMVSNRIIELDRGRLRSYAGNFAEYLRRKAEELSAEQLAQQRFDKLLAQEEVWIRQGVEARRTRSEGRVRRLEALRRERAARRDRTGQASITLDSGERSGRRVVELIDVSKRWEDRVVLDRVSLTVQRGDRVGIVGPNGVGKTTLLRLLTGDLEPDSGAIHRGQRLQIAYFDQLRSQLNEQASLVDTISPGSDHVEVGGRKLHVMSYLEQFLFSPRRARSPVSTLSGGERNRLLLARLLARPANLLVLDEPTNDLDIETLELLEELLAGYAGTLLLVSHDRAFLDEVVTQVIAWEGDGHWREYPGGYSDYQQALARQASAGASNPRSAGAAQSATQSTTQFAAPSAPPGAPPPAASAGSASSAHSSADSSAVAGAPAPASSPSRVKLSYKEQRELQGLPERIAALEAEQAQLQARLADPQAWEREGSTIGALGRRNDEIEQELMDCLERWEALEARR